MPVAAEIKVEKTELKEVVATAVAVEEVEATKVATVKVAAKSPKKSLCSSPQSPLKVLKIQSSQAPKFSSSHVHKFPSS